MTADDQQRQQEAQAAQEDQRRGMLVQLLHPAARERREHFLFTRADSPPPSSRARPSRPPLPPAVARIAMVKPEKAKGVEDMVLAAARRGALGGKVTEAQLIDLLEQVSGAAGGAPKTKVTIQRRRAFDDEDEDF
jgi:DNA-binding TFAR19-related protein (PDSD5 family)